MAADSVETMGAGKTQAAPGVKCDDKLPRKNLIECFGAESPRVHRSPASGEVIRQV